MTGLKSFSLCYATSFDIKFEILIEEEFSIILVDIFITKIGRGEIKSRSFCRCIRG